MCKLTQIIKDGYKGNITDGEARLASDRLVGFFNLLSKVAERRDRAKQETEKATQTKEQVNNDVLYEV